MDIRHRDLLRHVFYLRFLLDPVYIQDHQQALLDFGGEDGVAFWDYLLDHLAVDLTTQERAEEAM